jgi:1-acyl-sn-glycerol-3-phosphate acyltransferase
MIRLLKGLYSIYACIIFVAIMLLIFPFVIISSFFGRIRGGNMILGLCRIWADLWFPLILMRVKIIYEVPHDKKRSCIFLTNHISYLDAALIPKAFRQPIRPLAKAELSKIPLFGFIYKNAVVAVNRNSAIDRANSVRILKSITKKGISVLVFPEGTFNMTNEPLKEFYDGAFRVAIEMQIPIKPVLFLDNYKRMSYHSVFSMTPGKCRVLYMDEIPVEGLTLKDLGMLKQKCFDLMAMRLEQLRNKDTK